MCRACHCGRFSEHCTSWGHRLIVKWIDFLLTRDPRESQSRLTTESQSSKSSHAIVEKAATQEKVSLSVLTPGRYVFKDALFLLMRTPCAYLVQLRTGTQRTERRGCCSVAPAIYPAGRTDFISPSKLHKAVVDMVISVNRNMSYLLVDCCPAHLLSHLVGADSTKHSPVSVRLHRLWLQNWRDMISFSADIDDILPVCVCSCRGFIRLAQSNALIWSPGRNRRPRRLDWCGLTVFWAEVLSGTAHNGAITAGAPCVRSSQPSPCLRLNISHVECVMISSIHDQDIYRICSMLLYKETSTFTLMTCVDSQECV